MRLGRPIDDELKRQILLFQAITEHAQAVIAAKDLQGRYIFVNEEFSRLFKIRREACLGRTDRELFEPEFAQAFRRNDLQALMDEQAIMVEERAPVDGQLRHYLSMKFPVRDLDGKLFATGLVATDISTLKQLAEELQLQAETDELTGIWNRRKLFEVGQREIVRALRYGFPLSLALFDIDHFKSVNDCHGHGAGDRVLVGFCRLVTEHLRRNDCFGRLGGEEFVVILPHTPLESARLWAERIVGLLAAAPLPIEPGTELSVTVSAGVAHLSGPVETFEQLLKVADSQLYRAKCGGRNCVRMLPD